MRYNQKLFGVREETLRRLEDLYGPQYFENRSGGGGEDYRREEAKREKMYAQEMERIKKYIPTFAKGGSVLDVGCGRGEFLSLWGEQWEKFGIELSDHARVIAESRGVTTHFDPEDNFFDAVVFRGTIQHIPDPIMKISECYYWLKPGGSLIFLATPNTHGIVYRLFQDLPFIKEHLNFLLPSDKMLRQILTNFGFSEIIFIYPYWGIPYARPAHDITAFILRLFRLKRKTNFPFWGNSMECFARKASPPRAVARKM
ncbi:MAG: hypothetical protein G01um101433_321 [Parcubacteria group bacterium Gr01-1014_33]|nr:MAG: hypothetical protein G01um101433_321 [Parcubacteria group bacterium Gr01-1014_33]